MKFPTPLQDRTFEIPDDWWQFCDMHAVVRVGQYYPYTERPGHIVEIVELTQIQPLTRAVGEKGFRKYKLIPVLMAFQDPTGLLPPIQIQCLADDHVYRFKLVNGFHRYYASVAFGYSSIPAIVGSE